VKGPTAADLLVQKTVEAERFRVLMIANESKDVQELRDKLSNMLQASPG